MTAMMGTIVVAWPHAASAATADRPFSSSSPWNTAISTSATVDPNSAAMMAYATRNKMINSALFNYAEPIYVATSTTPKYTVTCTITSWGSCPFNGYQVPIPTGAKPAAGSDGQLVSIDVATGKSYELWQAKFSKKKWTASFGGVIDLNGSGWGYQSTGSGASRIGGVIRVAEIQAGVIPHTLSVATDNVCAGTFRSPATKTDGTSSRSDCIPEGARIQLDPNLDLSQLQMSPASRAIARALQVYGAFVSDKGGSAMGLRFERAPDATSSYPGAVYYNAGLKWDYYGITDIPMGSLRVMR